MSTAVTPLARRLELSATAFRWLAWLTVLMLIAIVATGATVRLTGSGLGCHHWPGCTPHRFSPRGFHSDVEFGNRVVAAFTVFVTLALAVGSILARRARALSWAVFAGTLAQAPLGAITIHYDLNPYLVISHLLLSLFVLGLAVLVAAPGAGAALPVRARQLAVLLLASVTFLVVTGTLATAAGKFPGSSGDQYVERIGRFTPSVALHVKAVAIFGVLFLVMLLWAWRNRFGWLVRGCAGLIAILAGQMVVGEFQYREYGTIPWWVVLIHVALAATLFAWTVGVVARVWRPAAN
ncbi:MAG: COX15/CtaA family protein [Actinomycetota bacterium]